MKKPMLLRRLSYFLLIIFLACSQKETTPAAIDRHSLVNRHNVVLHAPDTLGSLSVGNGEFAFTVDVTGLQTFFQEYENGIPLGTQTQWAWHSIPSKEKYSVKDVAREYESCDGTKAPYAVQRSGGREGLATQILRANPHRLHLGLVGLILLKAKGDSVKLEDLVGIEQTLDLWSGRIESKYQVEGIPVQVILFSHQQEDGIAVRVESPLIDQGRLMVSFNFPYGKDCHVCPGYDWQNSEKHRSVLINQDNNAVSIRRELDSTTYFTHIAWADSSAFNRTGQHSFVLQPSGDKVEFSVLFDRSGDLRPSDYAATEQSSTRDWNDFWMSGGAIDFSGCKDPRANELERRVVLSQYLTKIQCSGSMPPQETGLTMNSWYGKFHLEMHWWHAAQFALWGRAHLLEESLRWYADALPKAEATAKWQGYRGARWQKMTDPYGDESPSDIGAFIIWQQPHPIYMAELLYRSDPGNDVLQQYKEMVFSTAEFMASFVREKDGKFHLCHPLIPAQEIFKAEFTDDPAYELQYWHFGLTIAQEWRKRLNLPEEPGWKKVIDNLAPLSISNSLYLPTATSPEAYTNDGFRRDHPCVTGAFGFLPYNSRIDTVVMANTLENILGRWQWESTWGWDYPLLAMNAARLNHPDDAVKALLMNVQKNTYLVNGHNYQDKRLRLYLPGNGGLLAAVAMMTAGWDGTEKETPGFPKDGNWNVRWEGLKKAP
jgi:hypothetical protein